MGRGVMFKKLAFWLAAAAMTTSLGGCLEYLQSPQYQEYLRSVERAERARPDAATLRRWAEAAAARPPDPRTRLCHSSGPGGSTTYRCTEAERAVQDEAARQVRWSGPHVGASGGGGKGHSNQTDTGILIPTGGGGGPVGDGSFSLNGGLIGGGGGYDLQYAQWVFGLEADYSWADINGSSGGCGAAFISHTCSTGVDSLGTFRGRIGYPLGADGSWLLYATGGLAYGELKGSDSLFNASGNEFRAGYTVGGGVEKALAQHWTVKGEYLYVDLGHAVLFNAAPGVPETVSFTSNIFRVGMNYKFY
jgi:opacity protein-like surface antigen